MSKCGKWEMKGSKGLYIEYIGEDKAKLIADIK